VGHRWFLLGVVRHFQESLSNPGQELRSRHPGGVVGASRCDCVALGVVCRQGSGDTLTPALSRRAREQGDVADCHRRHERPQRMIRREHFRVAMTVFSGRRHEGRKTIQKLVRGQGDRALRVRTRRLLRILAHVGEPVEPPPVSPARGPPTDWGELVQAHFRPRCRAGISII